MILFDTNILIEIYKDNTTIIDIVKKIGQENIAISDVTCAELLFGARNKKELKIIRKDLDKLTVLSIDIYTSRLAVELVEKYAISHKLSLPDALIAATSIIHDIQLYTLNLKDFRFLEGLKFFDNID